MATVTSDVKKSMDDYITHQFEFWRNAESLARQLPSMTDEEFADFDADYFLANDHIHKLKSMAEEGSLDAEQIKALQSLIALSEEKDPILKADLASLAAT